MSKQIFIYHASCPDGFGAAWITKKHLPDATFVPMIAGTGERPSVSLSGSDVIIADMAFERQMLLELKSEANSLIVLDHHEKNFHALGDLDFCKFDMNKSGARLTLEYFEGENAANWLVDYIQDGDLYKFQLPNSREIVAAIHAYDFSFEQWDSLFAIGADALVLEGMYVRKHSERCIRSIINNAREVEFLGFKVMACNSPIFRSEIGNILCQGWPFSVIWREVENGNIAVSLRSTNEGLNVNNIAQQFPYGGGHRNAAGMILEPKTFFSLVK